MTESNQPGSSCPCTSAGVVEGQLGYLTLTGLVQDWADDTYPDYGIKLHENGNNGTHWKRLISQEQGGALDEYGPVLEVTWHFPVATTTTPYNWTTSRTLDWDFSDSQSHYQAQVSLDPTFATTAWDSGIVASSTTNATIPGGVTLNSGGLYRWRVRAKDGLGWSAWDSSSFIWDTTAPGGTISINGGAASTNSSSVRVDLAAPDFGTTNAYVNDGRSLSSIVAGCGSTTCGSAWASPTLGLSPTEGAIVSRTNTTGWHSLTVDAAGTHRQIMAFDVMRDGAHPVQIGIVSNDNDGYRFEMRAITSPYVNFTSYAYSRTSTPGSYTTESGVNIPFTPGVWYRFIVSSTGNNPGTYNMWWYERDATISATPAKIVTDLYLPNPRLHIFSKLASGTTPTHLWIDDVKIAKDDANSELGSGTTAVRFSTDGGTGWTPWTGYAEKMDVALAPGLQRRLILNGDSTVTFVDADGARHTFTNPQTAGSVTTYTRPASLYAVLVRDTASSPEFTLTYRDQSRDRFEISGSAGRLKAVEDRHGNPLTLAYDGAGNLSTVTDPASRVVDFSWDTAPTPDRLTTITDWAWIDGSGEVQASASAAARRVTAQGSSAISLSARQVAAAARNPRLLPMYRGQRYHQAVAREVNAATRGRVQYRTRGPDFVDARSRVRVELTTRGSLGAHIRRPGYGPLSAAMRYVTYAQ